MNEELEILKQIMNRLDKIEEKIDQLNDPYNLKPKMLPSPIPKGYKYRYILSDRFDTTEELK